MQPILNESTWDPIRANKADNIREKYIDHITSP